jgi:hypothetical protein
MLVSPDRVSWVKLNVLKESRTSTQAGEEGVTWRIEYNVPSVGKSEN